VAVQAHGSQSGPACGFLCVRTTYGESGDFPLRGPGAWRNGYGNAEARRSRGLSKVSGVYIPVAAQTKSSGMFSLFPPINRGAGAGGQGRTAADEIVPGAAHCSDCQCCAPPARGGVLRGCSRGCRFSVRRLLLPARARAAGENISPRRKRAVAATGWRDIGLLSLSTATIRALPLFWLRRPALRPGQARFAPLPSTRIDALEGRTSPRCRRSPRSLRSQLRLKPGRQR